MKKIDPYEHRGKKLSEMAIASNKDMDNAIDLFRTETDKWLKKIIALRIIEKSKEFDISHCESELQEAIKCQIN
ncbi:MAG: hypothetical protein IIA61_04635 [Candidatus Marinimicrobia bacterium]|nr:hypothetical protein [Candidatus Neomarinimicrobiota bacterium]